MFLVAKKNASKSVEICFNFNHSTFFSWYKFKRKKEYTCHFLYQKSLETIVILFSIYEKRNPSIITNVWSFKSAITATCMTVSMWFAYSSVTIVVDVLISSLSHKRSLISKYLEQSSEHLGGFFFEVDLGLHQAMGSPQQGGVQSRLRWWGHLKCLVLWKMASLLLGCYWAHSSKIILKTPLCLKRCEP